MLDLLKESLYWGDYVAMAILFSVSLYIIFLKKSKV
jgi:hypothetical protein